MITLQERARGAFLGLAVGDALGGPTEGKTPEAIAAQWGRVTDFLSPEQGGSDDTEYALFGARLLLEKRRMLTSADMEEAYRSSIINATNAYKGAGFSEVIAINQLIDGRHAPHSGQHVHSWSDGLAMRVAPYGIVATGRPGIAAKLAAADGAVTNAGEGIYSGQAVAAAVAVAMSGGSLEECFRTALQSVPGDSWTYAALERGIRIGSASSEVWSALPLLHRSIACSYYHWTDVAPEAAGLAFGILAASRGVYKDAVLGAVNIGRDTDTIAAVCGAVCGAMHGSGVIPSAWSERITTSRGICIRSVQGMNIRETADRLAVLSGEIDWSSST
ncbi:MAG: ADP-ribosylglycohydrolase family protein [Bacteroidetes bacterium]|nr:ADP-ribosylglycohydrolase family protein [Bacteroidota bacterium]